MVDDLGVTAPLLSDDGGVSARYKATTIPHLVVVGPTGRVVQVHRGFPGTATLERDIEAALARAGR